MHYICTMYMFSKDRFCAASDLCALNRRIYCLCVICTILCSYHNRTDNNGIGIFCSSRSHYWCLKRNYYTIHARTWVTTSCPTVIIREWNIFAGGWLNKAPIMPIYCCTGTYACRCVTVARPRLSFSTRFSLAAAHCRSLYIFRPLHFVQ